ncbi:hypothetical protein CI102_7664 [Trichoderma harzianum]|uniref:Uncharacterized protein n=1 Tax=Trichoderma harzianum CBS 226.95 TaxID=983964 RepID=A0A2T3ZYI8_TRIHA|nr:hypothetical protein M431DRAFT_268257 [Trichoderma harzianum CBS 226.95]PKK48156.1 hypothetical protein CI102_7664 [Trichoderma harzianum]PTB49877.1 hypothetical protein M431DRAFT_268257 [Trichoderma harzianum CBS 226.95]
MLPASDYPQYAQTGARPQSSGQVIPSWLFVSIPCISRSSPASPSLAAQCYRLLDRITGTSTYGVNVLVRAVARLEREQLAVSMVMGSVKLTVRCDAAERGRGVANLLLIQYYNTVSRPDPLQADHLTADSNIIVVHDGSVDYLLLVLHLVCAVSSL